MRAAENVEPPPALVILGRRFALHPFEQDLLLLCVAMELDTGIAALCARVHDDPYRPFPTFALAMSALPDPVWEALSPDRPLRYFRLIDVQPANAQPLTSSPLRAEERVVNFAKGLSHLDERLAAYISPLGGDDPAGLPESQQRVVDQILAVIRADGRFLPIQLVGPDSESKQLVARAVAQAAGVTLNRLGAESLPPQAVDLETLARLWDRDRVLLPLALYVDARDVDKGAENQAAPLKRFLARSDGLLFVDAREAWPAPQGTHVIDVAKPTTAEQRAVWTSALGEAHAASAARLSAQFDLSVAAIRRIVRETGGPDEPDLLQRLWARAAAATRLGVHTLAQRIDAKATWDDLVLPAAEIAVLRQIANQVRGRHVVYDEWGFRGRMNRGFGISALFFGDSGVGKTMAAEVIANDLALPLHRIDLSAMVSKWVGETEKNIQTVFQAAEDGGGILFFDEADALFGKRTEVQHSQDRFANIEINFLLQRMESYRGLVILATNMKGALDSAFMRRLRFIVNFPFPGPKERREIWVKAFPAGVTLSGIDYDRLARLNLTGGSIHNIALAAAFAAASAGGKVTMPILLEAARLEMRKLERPINENDFRWKEPA
jgi:hypothetical protein